MLEGELDQRMAAVQFEFGRDVVAVMFDGADTDTQFSRNGTARLAFRNQSQDAAFSRCELLERGFCRGERRGSAASPDEI